MFTSSLAIGMVSMSLTWVYKLIAFRMQANKELREAELRALNARAQITKDAREYDNKGFQYTRRFIAIVTTICVMVLPFAAVLWFQWLYPVSVIPGDPIGPSVYFGYETIDKGFWPFTSDAKTLHFERFQGIVITPWHTEMFAWIMGMYFGNRAGSGKM